MVKNRAGRLAEPFFFTLVIQDKDVLNTACPKMAIKTLGCKLKIRVDRFRYFFLIIDLISLSHNYQKKSMFFMRDQLLKNVIKLMKIICTVKNIYNTLQFRCKFVHVCFSSKSSIVFFRKETIILKPLLLLSYYRLY